MASAITVRPATVDDGPAMARIYRPVVESSPASFELDPPDGAELARRLDVLVSTGDPWLVAEVDGETAGYAYAGPFRSRPAYAATKESTVYVDPGHQGIGVGRTLLDALLKRLDDAGVRLTVAGIVLPNPASVALHEAVGYRHVGTFSEAGRKFAAWHDLGFWQRTAPAVGDGDGGRPRR